MREQLDCGFCDTLEEAVPRDPHNVRVSLISVYNQDIVLMPTVGTLVPGYLLAVSRTHITSFAQLEPYQLEVIDKDLTKYEARTSEGFGGPYFRMEHGSDNITFCGSGGCLDHALTHIVPGDDIGEHIQEAWSY